MKSNLPIINEQITMDLMQVEQVDQFDGNLIKN